MNARQPVDLESRKDYARRIDDEALEYAMAIEPLDRKPAEEYVQAHPPSVPVIAALARLFSRLQARHAASAPRRKSLRHTVRMEKVATVEQAKAIPEVRKKAGAGHKGESRIKRAMRDVSRANRDRS